MNRKNITWVFVSSVVIIPSLFFILVHWVQNTFQELPVFGKDGHRVKEFSLINQNKERFTLSHWDNKIIVANLFFTSCPVVCPKMTRNLKRVQEVYSQDSTILITSFSVDPERDSAERLKEFIRIMGIREGKWDLITGNKKTIYNLARNSLLVVATDGDGGQQDFIHSDRLVLIDKEKKIRGFYDGTRQEEVEQLIKDISRLNDE